MRDDVTASQATALSAQNLLGVWFVRLDIVDDPVYVWTGPDEITWDGKTWIGLGDGLGKISRLNSDTKGNIPGAEVELTGIDATVLASVKSEKYAGQPAYIYSAPLDLDDFSLVDDPFLVFAGEISDVPIAAAKSGNKVSATIESRLQLLRQSRPRYRTDEDQQREHSGDTFFEYVPKLAGKTIYWGLKRATTISSGRYAGGGRGDIDATHFQRL